MLIIYNYSCGNATKQEHNGHSDPVPNFALVKLHSFHNSFISLFKLTSKFHLSGHHDEWRNLVNALHRRVLSLEMKTPRLVAFPSGTGEKPGYKGLISTFLKSQCSAANKSV